MLTDNLKTLYGTTYVFFAKTFGFHHNVEGPNFPQYHRFLGKLYIDIYESLDKIAEYIRTLDSYAPGSLSRMLELSVIEEQTQIPRAELMFAELIENNSKYIELLNQCFSTAEKENQQGIANFIAERIDAHEKHAWMLRATLKKERA
jgi:starvation-inducible DNA-binding protein